MKLFKCITLIISTACSLSAMQMAPYNLTWLPGPPHFSPLHMSVFKFEHRQKINPITKQPETTTTGAPKYMSWNIIWTLGPSFDTFLKEPIPPTPPFTIGSLNIVTKKAVLSGHLLDDRDNTNYWKFFQSNPPSLTAPWFLVIVPANATEIRLWRTGLMQQLMNSPAFKQYKDKDYIPQLDRLLREEISFHPHVSIARIEGINNPVLLLDIIQRINRSIQQIPAWQRTVSLGTLTLYGRPDKEDFDKKKAAGVVQQLQDPLIAIDVPGLSTFKNSIYDQFQQISLPQPVPVPTTATALAALPAGEIPRASKEQLLALLERDIASLLTGRQPVQQENVMNIAQQMSKGKVFGDLYNLITAPPQ